MAFSIFISYELFDSGLPLQILLSIFTMLPYISRERDSIPSMAQE